MIASRTEYLPRNKLKRFYSSFHNSLLPGTALTYTTPGGGSFSWLGALGQLRITLHKLANPTAYCGNPITIPSPTSDSKFWDRGTFTFHLGDGDQGFLLLAGALGGQLPFFPFKHPR